MVNNTSNHSTVSFAAGLIHAPVESVPLIGPAIRPAILRRPLFRPPPRMPILATPPPAPTEPRPLPPMYPPAYPPLVTYGGRPVSPIPIHPKTIPTGFLMRDDLPTPRVTRTGTAHPSLPEEPFEPSPLLTTMDGIRLEITPASMQMRSNPETMVHRPIWSKSPPPARPTNPCRGCPRCRGPPELDPEA